VTDSPHASRIPWAPHTRPCLCNRVISVGEGGRTGERSKLNEPSVSQGRRPMTLDSGVCSCRRSTVDPHCSRPRRSWYMGATIVVTVETGPPICEFSLSPPLSPSSFLLQCRRVHNGTPVFSGECLRPRVRTYEGPISRGLRSDSTPSTALSHLW